MFNSAAKTAYAYKIQKYVNNLLDYSKVWGQSDFKKHEK